MREDAHDRGERGCCLIVEDNSIDERIIVRTILRAGIAVPLRVARTLGAARRCLARERARLILLDNVLPDGRGADFAIELSRDEAHRGVPVVLVTDWPSPFMFDKARRAGVLEVIGKSELLPGRVAAYFGAPHSPAP